MVSGPGFARLLGEFQAQYLAENDPNAEKSLKHHERGIPAQKTYQAQVLKLADAMKALGNLFQRACEHCNWRLRIRRGCKCIEVYRKGGPESVQKFCKDSD